MAMATRRAKASEAEDEIRKLRRENKKLKEAAQSSNAVIQPVATTSQVQLPVPNVQPKKATKVSAPSPAPVSQSQGVTTIPVQNPITVIPTINMAGLNASDPQQMAQLIQALNLFNQGLAAGAQPIQGQGQSVPQVPVQGQGQIVPQAPVQNIHVKTTTGKTSKGKGKQCYDPTRTIPFMPFYL